MSLEALAALSPHSLRALARLLERSTLVPDASRLSSTGVVPAELSVAAAALVVNLHASLGSLSAVARTLVLLCMERERALAKAPHLEVAWSGPEGRAPEHRTTLAVVQEMFATFRKSLLVSTYVVDIGDRANELFGQLAARMDHEAELRVRFFLNVPVPWKGDLPADSIGSFRTKFRKRVWPGRRFPEIWFDPRALRPTGERAVLHAKCVIADERDAFVTSANFTEAAHGRNIELGVLIRGEEHARAVARPFEALIEAGRVERLI